jgi:muramoyltetrapeptide carboxypeptidase
MSKLTIAAVSPGGTFEQARLDQALEKASALGLTIATKSAARLGQPSFLNGTKKERLLELVLAEQLACDAIWCIRGGCGAIELWQDYQKDSYEKNTAPLIGYSDNTILHFIRFYRASRIGIHGPVFLDLTHNEPVLIEALELIINKQAQRLVYPALKRLNHFVHTKLTGELLVMNLTSLESIIGCFDPGFFLGKILAIEDVNEPHYKIFRALQHVKNASALTGLKAILLGHIGSERTDIIEQTLRPLAEELGIPLFDWPIFGHEQPNWPIMFGAKATISTVDDHFFTLAYNEQHDHTPIRHDP